ncbi:RNA-directed DNA polymerase, eukaryota [Tanacetum coccineum]
MAIRGVSVDGEWIMDPSKVKQEFFQHFANSFSSGSSSPICFLNDVAFPVSLNQQQQVMLEEEVTDVEIKKQCGIVRDVFFVLGRFLKGATYPFIALIPKVNDAKFVKDFRPISLIGCQYKIMGKILANRLSLVIDSLVSKEQSVFIRGRQILNGPMILSEGLVSSTASILVNGSPTQEFNFQKGLRQGDLLSPFLFLLVMESLRISFVRAMEGGFFKGIHVGSFESIHISHLFYADDAVFIGEWKEENLRHLVSILQCFYLASGLRINIQKCSIMGVGGVTHAEVTRGANVFGCEASKTPFKYLGVMVGNKMTRIQSWDLIIDKVVARLSKWKAKTISIGGRFTLTKAVLRSIPLYYFLLFKVSIGVLKRLESFRSNFLRGVDPGGRKASWFSWDRVVASKEALPEALWVSVIKAIHGPCGNLDRDIPLGKYSVWLDCVHGLSQLKGRGVNLFSCMHKNVGNGNDTLFWSENWMGDEDCQGVAESMQLEDLSNKLSSLELVDEQDSWFFKWWELPDKVFIRTMDGKIS